MTKSKFLICAGLMLIAAALSVLGYDAAVSMRAEKASQQVLLQLNSAVSHQAPPPEIPVLSGSGLEQGPPSVEIGGNEYIGVLEIPALDLHLPVMADWDYEKLKIAPCRYSGALDRGDLIISAHNYRAHFGNLKELAVSDRVDFQELDGNRYSYAVTRIELLDASAVKQMETGEWDLTLFTCTSDGAARIAVRCELKD